MYDFGNGVALDDFTEDPLLLALEVDGDEPLPLTEVEEPELDP